MSIEVLLSSIKDDITKLVFIHGYDQGKLYKELTQHLRNEAETRQDPPIQVLYNTVHGGFCYHPRFRRHRSGLSDDDADDDDDRIDMKDAVRSFGAAMAASYPQAAALVTSYISDRRAIDAGLGHAHDFMQYRSNAETFERFLAYAGPWSPSVEPTGADRQLRDACSLDAPRWRLPSTITQLGDLSSLTQGVAAELASCVRERLVAVRQQTQDLEDKYTPLRLQQFVYALEHKFPEEVDEDKKPVYSRRKWSEHQTEDGLNRLAFLDALDVYGQDHFALWQCQCALPQAAMRYVMLCRPTPSDTDDSNADDADAERAFGLMCASGAYCNLAIMRVPAKLAWRIGEYDGKENVYVV